MCSIVRFDVFLILIFISGISTDFQGNIYNRVTEEEQFEGFSNLIRHNKDAQTDLLEKELTVFIPTNNAFQKYGKPLNSNLAFYHMATGARTLDDLKYVQNISSVRSKFAKLWITEAKGEMFVNNAEIISYKSNYPGRIRHDHKEKVQMLHIIDDVLDPVIRNPDFPYPAYDLMVEGEKWQLEVNKSVAMFLYKIREYKLTHLYQMEGCNTYFIPIDYSIDSHGFKMLTKNIIFGHIIPGKVLFTRPTIRGLNYRTMVNNDGIYTELSLEENDERIYVKRNTDFEIHPNSQGEMVVEIVQANIPVFNGVVHLISQPIGIFKRRFKPFPYLPIMDKLATDPTLTTIYDMGENTGFHEIFTTHNSNFTYFVPNDFAWRQIKERGLSFSGSDVDLLKRHLIVSDYPYSMERLLALSSIGKSTHVELKTVGGFLRLAVLQIEGTFFLRWDKTFIKVVRPNYECTDGLIHILAGPIANLN